MKKIFFAAGCFWGVEHYFSQVEGVVETCVGYMGGSTSEPVYEQVCSQTTGHAETVMVAYNEELISDQGIIRHFLLCHDPTQLNRQGPDTGTQYRSHLFWTDPGQVVAFDGLMKSSEMGERFAGKKVVTQVSEAGAFWKAEAYHQKYFTRNPHSCSLS